MAVTASCKNYTLIDDCSDYTTWNGETPANVTDFYMEGSACVGFTVRGDGANDIYLDPVSLSLSGKHLRCWMMTTALKELDPDSSGGIQFYLGDGSNTGYYYVGGSTTYQGGWTLLVLNCDRSPDSGSQPTLSAITLIGIRFMHTGTAKNAQNTWIDHVYVGDGIISYGDLSGSPYDFDDIVTIDSNPTYGWGLLRKIGGIFFSTGVLEFGDSAGSNSCDFNAQSDVVVFEMREVGSSNNISTSLMGINVVDNGTGTTEFSLGTKSGTAGVSGCAVRVQNTSQVSKFYVDGNNTNVDNFKIYGSSFLDASSIDFPAYNSNVEILNSTFESCGDISLNTATTKYCNFISANSSGAILSSTSHNMSDCSFINCTYGLEFDTAGTFGITNCVFTNNTYDVEFSAASGDLIVNATNSNPSNYSITGGGSSVTINVSADIDIEVVDIDDQAIENARVLIEADSDGVYPSYASVSIVASGTTATVTHSSHGMYTGQYVIIRGVENSQYYNGIFQITVSDSSTYTYTMSGSPPSPATGTSITATMRMMQELTISNGTASESVKYVGDQPIQGWIRKMTGTPIYKEQPISGDFTVDGFSAKYQLVLDE